LKRIIRTDPPQSPFKKGDCHRAFYAIVVLAAILSGGCGESDIDAPTSPVVETEVIGGVEFRHHFTEAGGLRWHWVDAGAGPPIVFVHGLPESWYSWHFQMIDLAAERRVIAVDLKGYGQTDKPATGYSVAQVATELAALVDAIGLDQFDLVTHDWGTGVGQRLAADHPEHIRRYVRMEAPVAIIDLENNHPQFELFQDQEVAQRILGNATFLVHLIYGYDGQPGTITVTPIPNDVLDRIVVEFSRPGTAAAVARYFVENPITDPAYWAQAVDLYALLDFPVLLLQGDADPNQPHEYFDGAESHFPDARLHFVPDTGHFLQLEQPEAVTAAVRAFLLD
jgi:pimeloyl-ACP methyl ester carboxylesterase